MLFIVHGLPWSQWLGAASMFVTHMVDRVHLPRWPQGPPVFILRSHSLGLGGLGVTKRKIQEWGISAGV